MPELFRVGSEPDKSTIGTQEYTVTGAEAKGTPEVVKHFPVILVMPQAHFDFQALDIIIKSAFFEIGLDGENLGASYNKDTNI